MRLLRFVLTRILFYTLVALIGLFFVLPTLWLFVTPFGAKVHLSLTFPHPLTLDNFRQVFRNTFAVRALFKNSIIQAGGTMLLTTFVATLGAYALSRFRIPGRDLLIYILILFSSVVWS